MRNNHVGYRYETLYKVPFSINQCFPIGTVNLQYGTIQNMHNIFRIKPYKSDTNIEYINLENMCDEVNI